VPRNTARFDQHIPGLAAIGAGIHAQRPADRAGNATIEGKTGKTGIGGGTRHFHVGHRRPGSYPFAFDGDLVEAATEADHHTGNTLVAHDQIRAETDRRDRNLLRQPRQEIGKIALAVRHEERLRRPANAKPGQFLQRLRRHQPAAQLRHPRFQSGNDVGKAHDAASSPGSA
jgi:hypothetical protein